MEVIGTLRVDHLFLLIERNRILVLELRAGGLDFLPKGLQVDVCRDGQQPLHAARMAQAVAALIIPRPKSGSHSAPPRRSADERREQMVWGDVGERAEQERPHAGGDRRCRGGAVVERLSGPAGTPGAEVAEDVL